MRGVMGTCPADCGFHSHSPLLLEADFSLSLLGWTYNKHNRPRLEKQKANKRLQVVLSSQTASPFMASLVMATTPASQVARPQHERPQGFFIVIIFRKGSGHALAIAQTALHVFMEVPFSRIDI